jgi:hypothetical protein
MAVIFTMKYSFLPLESALSKAIFNSELKDLIGKLLKQYVCLKIFLP